jgi:FlaA1/EpsC-like NDP-sugar epimerase
MKRFILRHRLVLILLLQAGIVLFALQAGYLLRFDFAIPPTERQALQLGLWLAILTKLPIFLLGGLDQGWSRFVSMRDLYQVLWVNIAGSALFAVTAWTFTGGRFPRSVYLLDLLLCFLATATVRCSSRIYHEVFAGKFKRGNKRILIYGAGAAGAALAKEIRSNPALGHNVVGFLDDDPQKRNTAVLTLPVMGTGRDAAAICARYARRQRPITEIVVAMSSASRQQMREVLANCRAAGVPCKTIPGVGELLSGKVLTQQLREISVLDLLGREPVHLEEDAIRRSIAGRTVMVTGAAGSIGSEICRQVARFGPRQLVLFEQAESDLFRIDNQLKDAFPTLVVIPAIGDIRDYTRVDDVIKEYRVESIYHAAAYKHVPMMEAHVVEAARNNVLGTRNVLVAAQRNRVADFLMISSDKAVNPANVMGATKRCAEILVSSLTVPESVGHTKCVSVRFGNVLGSNGSVVPVFREQIAAGGPVTVTHPEIRRYFMTIPEAVQLVLQASTMGKGSEIFVLDMGEPVKIVDLARNMIRLSGHEPDVDIEIRYTGLRPGEKLFEELSRDEENTLSTYHQKIKIFTNERLKARMVESWLNTLETLVQRRDAAGIVSHIQVLVPEYSPSQAFRKRPEQVLAAISASSAG